MNDGGDCRTAAATLGLLISQMVPQCDDTFLLSSFVKKNLGIFYDGKY